MLAVAAVLSSPVGQVEVVVHQRVAKLRVTQRDVEKRLWKRRDRVVTAGRLTTLRFKYEFDESTVLHFVGTEKD